MSDVPDERAEARWYEVRGLVHAIANDDINLGDATDALMALADAEVAAERQRLHDSIRTLADTYERYANNSSIYHPQRQTWLEVADRLRALVSPVSDDTGGTKP